MAGLKDRSRTPNYLANRTEECVERLVIAEKRLHPTWGPKKIHGVLLVKHGMENRPAINTVGEVLKRHGVVKARLREAPSSSEQRLLSTED